MENDLLKNIPDLLKLLETKDFGDLTGSERTLILRYWSKEEYDDYRQSVRSGKTIFGSEKKRILANPEIKEKLLKRIQSGKSAGKLTPAAMFIKLFTFRIPAYQPGFAIALLVFLFIFLHDKAPEKISYINRIDTVYMEKEAELLNSSQGKVPEKKSDIVIRKPGNSKERNNKSVIAKVKAESFQISENRNIYDKIGMVKRMPTGSTASHDSALLKFLVSAY